MAELARFHCRRHSTAFYVIFVIDNNLEYKRRGSGNNYISCSLNILATSDIFGPRPQLESMGGGGVQGILDDVKFAEGFALVAGDTSFGFFTRRAPLTTTL